MTLLPPQPVRDLIWLLQSPSLLGTHSPHAENLLPDGWRAQAYHRNQHLWRQHALDPAPLIAQTQKHQRLGHYAEALLHFLAQQDPAIALLAHNQQIKDKERTLGELDFIWNHNRACEHIELATKFYLLLPNAQNLYHAVGANCRDSLGRKWAQMCGHQLHLHEHTPNYPVDHAYAWLCGWIFTPPQHTNILPALNPEALQGTWGTWRDWLAYAQADDVWHCPPRLAWLSPVWQEGRPPAWQGECAAWQARQQAVLLTKLKAHQHGWVEAERWMIVADDWQSQAQALWGGQ